jgi:hypothetical protein
MSLNRSQSRALKHRPLKRLRSNRSVLKQTFFRHLPSALLLNTHQCACLVVMGFANGMGGVNPFVGEGEMNQKAGRCSLMSESADPR